MAITTFPTTPEPDDEKQAPTTGASVTSRGVRSSAFPEMSAASWVQGLFQNYAGLGYQLPFEVLSYVEILSTYNPDMSQAVDNVRTLANSGHELFVDVAAKRTAQRIKARLESKAKEIQGQHGGIDGLIDKLLDQAATYGAMCGEWVTTEDLTDVVDFVDVNPKTIRYFWDEEYERFAPFQKVNALQQEMAKKRGQEVRNGCVRLNEATFHYYAFDAMPGSPYGTPPFLAALPNIAIQRDMVSNMAQIVKKVGLLGMIDISIKQLPIKPGESNEAYQSRAENFLDQYVQVVEDMVRDGGIAHFDDVEVSTYQLAGNAAGATNIFKQNEELIFSGLKSMPSVQGRSYCVVPETRVLTSDLRWVEAGDLEIDDELIGFDEDLGKGRGHGAVARMKPSLIERNEIRKMRCVRVVTDKGEITVTREHPLVGKHRSQTDRKWYEASDLRSGDKLVWIGEPWEEEDSYDAGYLAGMFDGEASLGFHGSGKNGTLTFAQREGEVLDQTVLAMKRLGFDAYVGAPTGGTNKNVCQVRVLGGKWATMRFLGSIRPHRLLAKARQCWNGASIRNGGSVNQTARQDAYATVISVEDVGYRKVVCLQTSSRTFFSEGLLSHNSTTETYAGVAYDIIIRNTYKYQRAVKRMIEAGYWLMCTLWGEQPDGIRLVFNPNKSLHRLQDAQAFRMEIFNAVLMWVLGIWNQQDVSQALGQQEPRTKLTTVPASPLLGPMPAVGIGAKGIDGADAPEGAADSTSRIADVERKVAELVASVAELNDASGDSEQVGWKRNNGRKS